MTVKVTSDLFRGLTNPYTGKPMEVFMTVNPGLSPLFSSPDTYSTDDLFHTREECISAWDRKRGVCGLKKGSPITCAYTGEPLALVKTTGGMWHFVGGFNPHMFYSRDEFLRLASMRSGVSGYRAPKPETRVTAVPRTATITEAHRKSVESRTPSLDEGKIHEVETRLNGIGVRVKSGTVSMSSPAGRKGKRNAR